MTQTLRESSHAVTATNGSGVRAGAATDGAARKVSSRMRTTNASSENPVVFEAGIRLLHIGNTDVEIVAKTPIRLKHLGIERMVLDAHESKGCAARNGWSPEDRADPTVQARCACEAL